jgi:hypothetical protein
MLIRNLGHLWQRKYINYGRPRVRGHLKGRLVGEQEVDFRDQLGIYVLFDKDLMPVYVGQAGNGNRKLLARLKQHEHDHLWNRWEHFSWFGFRRVNQSGLLSLHDEVQKVFKATGIKLLNEVEGVLITALEPRLNKQGARWKDVDEYSQVIDDEKREPTLADIVKGHEKIEKLITSLGNHLRKKR